MLVKLLKKSNPNNLAKQLNLSVKLRELNYHRYQAFDVDNYTKNNASPCLWTFQGDVYRMLNAASLTPQGIMYAQKHLRILSGLYGLLRPLDLIQLYRLEMGCRIKCDNSKNLYEFWGADITDLINKDSSDDFSCIVNLASKEYGQVIHPDQLKKPIFEINFRQYRHGELKNIGLLAKRARGQMARFIIECQISNISEVKEFNVDGYQFNSALSNAKNLVFVTK